MADTKRPPEPDDPAQWFAAYYQHLAFHREPDDDGTE